MCENTSCVMDKKVEKTMENLEKNNMNAFYVEDEKALLQKIAELINESDTVSVGGSMTIFATGIIDLLRSGKYNFLDRHAKGLSEDDIKEVYRKSFFSDAYFTSSNAVTENGELYNVDGLGNRVAAMIYGPDKVIVVVGINKIVKDVAEAIERNKKVAAPANSKRLNKKTPCAKLGYCTDCKSPERICNNYVLIKKQWVKGRMNVIILNKEVGY